MQQWEIFSGKHDAPLERKVENGVKQLLSTFM